MSDKTYIVTSSDAKIGTENFRSQATTEAGKVFGVKSDGTVGLINGTTAVDDVTIEINSDDKLQVKEKGLELDRLKSQATTDSGKVVGVQDDGTMGLLEKQDVIQYSTMPTASASLVNKVIQYIGDTTTEFTNGVFYRCILSAETGDYEWKTASGDYLPTTGGYMTGTIETEVDASSMMMPALAGVSSNGILLIQSETNGGAGLRLFSSGCANEGFSLTTGSGSTELAGNKDGTLKWNSNNVLTTADITDNLTTESTTNALSANQGKVLDEKKQDVMQFSTMPTASAEYVGKMIQYIGESTTEYTDGCFYKCVHNEVFGTYSWEPASGSAYLPLAGGTITGTILSGVESMLLEPEPTIKGSTSDSIVIIQGGGSTGGSSLQLNGDAYIQSGFTLKASDTGGSYTAKALVGLTNGDLTWNSKNILTTDYIVDNLTTESTDKALSANQGKVLNDTKLSLSGGEMTGSIDFASGQYYMRATSANLNSTKYICGGTGPTTGASLQLADGAKNGYFFLKACTADGSTSCYLQGTPAGALTWGSKNVLTGSLSYHRHDSSQSISSLASGSDVKLTYTFTIGSGEVPTGCSHGGGITGAIAECVEITSVSGTTVTCTMWVYNAKTTVISGTIFMSLYTVSIS